MAYKTIAEMFLQSVEAMPNHPAYCDKVAGEWKPLTYGEVGKIVESLAYGLASLGVQPGDNIAIISTNNAKWGISDYAITCLGAAVVTVYPTLIAPQIKYIINDADTKFVIAQDEEQLRKVLEFTDDAPTLKGIIVMNDVTLDHPNVLAFSDVVKKGEDFRDKAGFEFRKRALEIKPEDLLTLIYTSGTTGNPKGVMLTHNNLVTNIKAGRKAISIDSSDVFLSFLPLSHSFERMVGHYTAFSANGTVYFAEGIETVAENMLEVRPTVMASVPRLFEKIYIKVLDKVSNDPPLRQKIFWWAIGVGRQAAPLLQRGKTPQGMLAFKYGLANKLVFSKLAARVGGRLRFFVSGGAPLSKDIGEFFTAAGIKIIEGYGLTETSPVITVNREDFYKFGTVGRSIEDVEVKIAADGEILCKGPNVMRGYYKNDEATREVMEDDGWFHTGDVGEFDEDNYLCITDRKKNLLVTSGGKNIAPSPLENALLMSKYIEQCLVIGDKRNFVSALLTPSFEALEAWTAENGLASDNHEELVKNEQVLELFNGEVEEAMKSFSRYEQVKKFTLLPDVWSIASGELTPKLSVKRKEVEKKYARQIEALYSA